MTALVAVSIVRSSLAGNYQRGSSLKVIRLHYYQFNIGDYSSHTSRLSNIEDLAYRRLLDLYYLNERPLNGCSTDVAREIGLTDFQQEVDYILSKYFPHDGENYINKRADREISLYHGKKKQASDAGKASAKARKDKKKPTGVERTLNEKSTDEQLNIKHKTLNNNYSTDDFDLSVSMYELIINIAPHTKKPNFESWANIIRLMREVDKIPLVTIQQVFNWANSDDFWKTNILSASKLRKQFNQLQAKMVNTNENNQRPDQAGRPSAVDRVKNNINRARSERGVAPLDGGIVAENGSDVRVHVHEAIRGGTGQHVGQLLEGDFSETDS